MPYLLDKQTLPLLVARELEDTSAPQCIQLHRTKGWRMPPNTRKVDRSTRFGNPFEGKTYGREEAVRMHQAWLTGTQIRSTLLPQ